MSELITNIIMTTALQEKIEQASAELRGTLELLTKKQLFVKMLPASTGERLEIYTAYRAWKCRPMMPAPWDEVYVMHEADVVFVGCIRNVAVFAREWK